MQPNPLVQQLKTTVKKENHCTAVTIKLLAKIADDKVHLAHGYSNLFSFCSAELCMSEGSIYRRIQVAKCVNRYPLLLTYLAQSKLSLTVISELCPYLSRQRDIKTFLNKFIGKSKRQTQEILAGSLKPRPAPRDRSRRIADREVTVPASPCAVLPFGASAPQGGDVRNVGAANNSGGNTGVANNGSDNTAPQHNIAPPSSPRTLPTQAVREACYEFTFAAGKSFKEKLAKLRDHLAHKFPEGKMEEILEYAMDALLKLIDPSRPKRSPKEPKATDSRYIPVMIRDHVQRRSQGRCEYVAPSGKLCGETRFLQLDHRVPLALGGKTELDNIQHLCSQHNQYKADVDHGRGFMAGKR